MLTINESCKRGGKHIGMGLDENCPTSGNQTQPQATPYSVDATLGYHGQAKLVIHKIGDSHPRGHTGLA